jgi:hypothetical protein
MYNQKYGTRDNSGHSQNKGPPQDDRWGHPLIALRITKKMIAAVDKWAAGKGMSRSAAIHYMIERTLIFDKH